MRRGLELRYNSLNLLYGVNLRNGRSIRYLRLSDGRKLGIRFSDGSPGYDYSGNMTYKVTKGKIERESLAFGGGCITSTGSGSYEVRYWLRDHLGSVRAVRTASGRIVEENAYYPFGLRQRRQDYAVSGNRYRYNGKEQQIFGYLDYGFRMYDACLGRWHSSDPLSERDPGISGYAYVKNAPLRYRDILGLTYTGYGDVPPYKYRWTPDGYELEEVVVTAPRGGSGYAFPILGAMGYSRQSGALWRTVFTWERYFESASDLHSVYGNASPHTSYCIPNPQPPHPYAHTTRSQEGPDLTSEFNQRISEMQIFFGSIGDMCNAEQEDLILSYLAKIMVFGYIQYKGVRTEFMNPKSFRTSVFYKGGYVDGKYYTADDFGNYFYGVAAKAMGITLLNAIHGAGIYAIFSGSVIDWTNWYGFFDERKDTQMIIRGYNGQ